MARDEEQVQKALEDMAAEMTEACIRCNDEEIVNSVIRKMVRAIDAGATKKELRKYYMKHLSHYMDIIRSDYLRG